MNMQLDNESMKDKGACDKHAEFYFNMECDFTTENEYEGQATFQQPMFQK